MLQQKYKMLEAELSIIAVFPFGSVLFRFVQCSPSQTKRRLILRWNECKVIPGCWVMKRICEVHYTGLGFGMGTPEGEEGTVPASLQIRRGRGQIQNHLQLHEAEGNVCFGMCKEVPDGLISQRPWQPATVFCSRVLVISMGPEL